MGMGLHFGVSHNECLFNIQLIVEPYFVSSTGLGADLKGQWFAVRRSIPTCEKEPIVMDV